MANVFNIAKLYLADQTKDLTGAGGKEIDCLLLTGFVNDPMDTTAYDLDNVQAVLADGDFTEASDTTYLTTTEGRRNVTMTTHTENSGTDQIEINFTPDGNSGVASWDSIDNDVVTAIMFYWRAAALNNDTDATAVPLCVCPLTSDVTTNGGAVTITFSGDFIMTFANT